MISKLKIHKFLGNRNEKNQHKLEVAVEVIQDFLNCDPIDIGRLQAVTYDHIDKVYDEEQEETSQEEWIKGYREWKSVGERKLEKEFKQYREDVFKAVTKQTLPPGTQPGCADWVEPTAEEWKDAEEDK